MPSRDVCEWDCSAARSITGLLAASPGAWEGEGCWSRAVGLSRQPCGDSRALSLLHPVPVSGFCSAAGNLRLSRQGRSCICAPLCSCPGPCFCPWLCFCPRPGSAKPPLCRGGVGDVDAGEGGYADLDWGSPPRATMVAGSRHVPVRGLPGGDPLPTPSPPPA